MTTTFAIVNQKGGVGKTTTAINLATALAVAEKKTLLIDLDPQGNTSTGFGIESDCRNNNIYTLLSNLSSFEESVIISDIVENLHIIPSTVDLSAAEIELVSQEGRENFLKNILAPARELYDFIFIDCPPSLGMLTINAMTAADSVIIPLQCEFFSLEGLSHLIRTYELVKKNYNNDLIIEGILLTMYDKRNKLTLDVEKEVRTYFGRAVFDTVIPRNVRMSEAPSHGKPVIIYDYRCNGSKSYMYLAREILHKQKIREEAADKKTAPAAA